MAFQPEQPNYDIGVYQIETTDPVDGGVGSITNSPLLALANRTAYLFQHVSNLESGATQPPGMAPLNSPDFTGTPTAPTALGGDNSSNIANTLWVQGLVYGVSTINCAGSANVVLTAAQAAVGVLELTGVLTGNISVIVPNTLGKWQIVNVTTGAFTVTVKTATGSGVVVAQSKHTQLYCDGSNVGDSKTDFPSPALTGTPTTPTAASGDNSTIVASTGFVSNATDGMATVNVAGNADVALTSAQAGAAILNLTGVLTGNINLRFPQSTGQWVVANNSTGTFAITAKTTAAAGTTAVLPQGSAVIVYSDGTNMFFASSGGQTSLTRTQFNPAAGTATLTVATGYTPGNIFIEKNGLLLEQAAFTATDGSTITLTTATIANDVITVYAFKTFNVANAVLKSGDTMNGPLALHGGDTGTTAAAGDNTTKLATTGFVHAALLGNLTPASVAANTGAAGAAGAFTTNGSTGTISVTDTGANGANIALHGNGTTTPNKFIRADNGNLDFINSAYSAVIATMNDAGALTVNGLSTPSVTSSGGATFQNGSIDIGHQFPTAITAPVIEGTTELITGSNVGSSGATLILNSSGVGQIVLRPGGGTNAAGQAVYSSIGNLSIAGTLSQGSDARVKTNVQKIEGALDIVTKYFVGVTFERTDSPGGEPVQCDAGFISQDVEVGVPSLVQEVVNGDITDFKNLKYVNMLAYMANAISELNDIVQAQGATIAAMNAPAQ